MIGWKCNAGVYTYEENSDIFTDLSQFEFLDFGVPFLFTTQGIVEEARIPSGQDVYTLLRTYIGTDVDQLFSVPIPGYNESTVSFDFNKYYPILPSAYLGFVNTSNRIRELRRGGLSKNGPVFYFPQLKRVFICARGSSIGSVYSVEGTKLTQIARNLNDTDIAIHWCHITQYRLSLEMWHYKGTDSLEDLLNNNNYIDYTIETDNGLYNVAPVSAGSQIMRVIRALFSNNYVPPDWNKPDDPYEPGGPSGPTDPDLPPGSFDDESDPIPDSSLPTISAANTGFTRIYNPTLSQVQALARYLWTDESVIETIWNHIKQFFENPMEAIIGFNLVPVPVPDGGTENFALMYIDTGVSMTVAANQFVDMDCGTVELKRYYGSALDQSPYTKVSCFLPYIGTVNLNTDEVMGTTLQVKYRVDIVSGSCVAKIFVDGNCLYQYSGHCAITIPISSADFSSYVSAAISVGKLAAAAITAGAGAVMAAGVPEASQQTNQVVTTTQVTTTARNPSSGRQITTGTTTTVQTRESPADQSSTQASFSGLAPQNVANTVGAIMSSKPHIEHSGSFSGNSGYLGVRRPFLIIERPNMCMPANYQALNGFPSMITMELSTCKGFTRVQQVQLTEMGRATNPEQAEVMELLKSGVIL